MSHAESPQGNHLWTLAAIGSFVVNAGVWEHTMRLLVEWLADNQRTGNISFTRSLSGKKLLARLREDAEGSAIEAGVRHILDSHKADECMNMRQGG